MTNKFKKLTNASLKTSFFMMGIFLLGSSCTKTDNTPTPAPTPASYSQVNLVSDTAGFGANRIDTSLRNAWGIAIGATGTFWIAANHSGSTVVYDNNGLQKLSPVKIPLKSNPTGASPTGVVFNTTAADFVIPGNGKSSFIYSTEDGILSAWNSSTGGATMTVADRSAANAVYKGLALATDAGANFLYATDFHNGKVDVYDNNFTLVTTKPFNDPNIPAGFAPFNIQNIGGQLYVTYAKQKPDKMDDTAGVGNGFVDIYTPAGTLVKRFATQGTLNSPWGIVQAPSGFGQVANAILVGNFGDGFINVFDASGVYQGQLKQGSNAIVIKGLWALTFDNVAPADPNLLYFTAGPNEESHGVFGYLKKN